MGASKRKRETCETGSMNGNKSGLTNKRHSGSFQVNQFFGAIDTRHKKKHANFKA